MVFYIYSYGKKEKLFPLEDNKKVLLRWGYVGLFRAEAAFFRQYFLIDSDKETKISKQELLALKGGDKVTVPFFEAFGFYVLLIAFLILGRVYAWSACITENNGLCSGGDFFRQSLLETKKFFDNTIYLDVFIVVFLPLLYFIAKRKNTYEPSTPLNLSGNKESPAFEKTEALKKKILPPLVILLSGLVLYFYFGMKGCLPASSATSLCISSTGEEQKEEHSKMLKQKEYIVGVGYWCKETVPQCFQDSIKLVADDATTEDPDVYLLKSEGAILRLGLVNKGAVQFPRIYSYDFGTTSFTDSDIEEYAGLAAELYVQDRYQDCVGVKKEDCSE